MKKLLALLVTATLGLTSINSFAAAATTTAAAPAKTEVKKVHHHVHKASVAVKKDVAQKAQKAKKHAKKVAKTTTKKMDAAKK
jgi:hypothetical protein